MRILAADTATAVNTAALWEAGVTLAETQVQCGRKHAERFMDTVDWVLREANLGLDDVDCFAVSAGPGSFTGLRIGVAAMKGLALATGKGLLAVPTLDAMTRLAPFHGECVVPLLDARMQEVFGAVYEFEEGERRKLTADRVCAVEDLLSAVHSHRRPPIFLGDGAHLYAKSIRKAFPSARIVPPYAGMPRAAAVAAEAAALIEDGASMDAASVAPVYLRKSQAEEARDAARESTE